MLLAFVSFLFCYVFHVLSLSLFNSRQLCIHLMAVSSTLMSGPAPAGFHKFFIC